MALALLASLGLVSATHAQTPRFIEAGEIVTGEPGQSQTSDLYQFVGVVGSQVTITLDTPGHAALSIYEPHGEEMTSATGSGTVTLRAVLPLTEAYTVSVSRTDISGTYSLGLSATEPDLHQMFFARGMGYESHHRDPDGTNPYIVRSCWLDPGRKMRRIWPRGIEEHTLGRDGMEYIVSTMGGGEPRSVERQIRFEGASAIYPTARADGTTRYTKIALDLDTARVGPFGSYLCE
ncbi:hypothetical protein [Sphingopyxis sp. JAI128]|uniref:hypothetical protein n=1 Tax=Sphingopyxis sp. JAI128 TaxID=2723066 RepID=UPI001608A5AF|nr:hypothetical protein [Sphingopyxis sp. JAI128]MBB6425410.1 hypothetical protein [Sphingopyxis sp. JAI128]